MRETTLGPYVLVDKLGSGGMGEVYRARDDRLHREVAIKRLPADAAADPVRRRALLQEARSVARISHQNVATLHDVLEHEDQLYLVMELVTGETLAERCAQGMGLDETLAIAIQCAEGLAAAHRQGIVHGDVKPDNVMISADGEAKILDFGVARLVAVGSDATEAYTDPTSDHIGIGGTLPFMAPEALLGNRLDQRADIFSLGVTLYRALAGAHPFAGNTPAATVDRILHGDPTPAVQLNPKLPEYLMPVLDKMLAKAPEKRYATMDDLLVDLRAAHMRVTKPDVQPVDGTGTLPPAPGRARFLEWGVLAVILTVIAVALWQWMPSDSTPASAPVRFDASDWIIAVFPTASAVDDAEIAALADGMAVTLTGKLTQMSRAHDLQVLPASALQQREIRDYASARQELGVTLAIDFQLRRIGDRLRANVNLIDTREDRQLASDTVDGSVDDPIDLEEQLALRALRLLRLELLPVESGLLEASTDDPRAHGLYLRATGYLQEYDRPDSVDAAVDLLEQALRIDPGYARAQATLGQALWSRYRLTDEPIWVERATRECEEAIETAANESAGYRCLGTVYEGTGRSQEAAAALERARRLDPTDDETYIALASAYVDMGEPEAAEATYEEAISLRPHYWGGYSWLGFFYLGQGRPSEAVGQFEQVVRLAPDSYRGFSNLGGAYYFAEDWSRARQAFERALALNPDFHSAISNIGTLYFYEGRYSESAEMFERAVELAPDSYLMHGNLADAYRWSDAPGDSATAEYRRAIELAAERLEVNPDDAEVNSHVALYHAQLAEPEAALRHLARALDAAPQDIAVLHAAAQVHITLGDRDQALNYLTEAVGAGYQRSEIELDPIFEPLRDTPEYAALMER